MISIKHIKRTRPWPPPQNKNPHFYFIEFDPPLSPLLVSLRRKIHFTYHVFTIRPVDDEGSGCHKCCIQSYQRPIRWSIQDLGQHLNKVENIIMYVQEPCFYPLMGTGRESISKLVKLTSHSTKKVQASQKLFRRLLNLARDKKLFQTTLYKI